MFVWEMPALRWMRFPRGTQNAGKGTLIMRVRVLIMLLRVLIMLFRVLIKPLRVLIMLLRVLMMLLRVLIMLLMVLIMLLMVLIMPLRVLMMRAKRSDEAGRRLCARDAEAHLVHEHRLVRVELVPVRYSLT